MPNVARKQFRGNKPEDIKKRQDAFLEAFSNLNTGGTIREACEIVGIHRDTVKNWRKNDLYGFAGRFMEGEKNFAEAGERNWLYSRLEDPKCHPNLVMFALKALMPQKYRELALNTNITGETIIDELKKARQQIVATASEDTETEATKTVQQQAEDVLRSKGN